MEELIVNLEAIGGLTDDQLLALCRANKTVHIERNAEGELIVMAPAGGFSSVRSMKIGHWLSLWNDEHNAGIVFDSSGGFRLPSGAMYVPDAAFVRLERWNALTREEQEHFAPLCSDFVVEIRSQSDRLKSLQKKMGEWRENGYCLAWLIDPFEQQAYIYRADGSVETASFDAVLSGEEVLPGFSFPLAVLS